MLLVPLVAGAVGIVLAISYFGRAQEQKYAAEVAASIASTQPDAAFLQGQAEIEQNLAAADALAAQLDESPTATATAPPPPPPAPEIPPPDPTL